MGVLSLFKNEIDRFSAQEYTNIQLVELVTKKSVNEFDFAAVCDMYYYIFQDIYE